MFTEIEDIIDDYRPLYAGDIKLQKLYYQLRMEFEQKGLPYFEVGFSKTSGNIQYLLKGFEGYVTFTDLESGVTHSLKL